IGTCKHIERVRTWYQRQPKKPPAPAVSVWWRPGEWLASVPDPLREIRCDVVEAFPPAGLRGYFDDEGSLLAPPADTTAIAWVEAAIESARLLAAEGGLAFDLDPAVAARVEEARAHAELSARLRAVEVGDDLWTEIVSTLGFKLHPYQEEGAVFLAQS